MTLAPGLLRVELAPDPARWAGLIRQGVARRDSQAPAARAELGLGADRPVVMTGHQLVLWHPGILAKLLAAHAVAESADARVAWVGVDQDSEIATDIRYPVSESDGGLRVETLALRKPAPGDIPAASLPPASSPPLPALDRTPASVRDGLQAIHAAWNRHATSPSAAHQIAGTLADLLTPWVPASPVVMATALASTTLFRFVVDRMRSDARRCVEVYNAAVAANPAAQMQPLRTDASGVELPLWSLAPGQPRRRVHLADLAATEPATLAPRALLMTGLLRWAACDLFVHGKGGAIYDTITERWLGEWLGVRLAPTVMATADLLLPLQPPGVTPRAAADAHWRAHRAEHDPGIIGDAATAATKLELVQRIAHRRRAGERPLDDYRRMHAALAEYRSRNAGTLAELKSSAVRLSAAVAAREIAADRTWAFPLHAPEALGGLRSTIRARFR